MAGSSRQVFANNAKGVLAAELAIDGYFFTLQSGEGAKFPSSGWFTVTLEDDAGNIEIIDVTWRSGDLFMLMSRGAEGTTPRAWPAGTQVEMRVTAGALASMVRDGVSFLVNTATVAIDLSAENNQKLNVNQATSFSTSNRKYGGMVDVLMVGSGIDRTLTFPAEWSWVGGKPSVMKANTNAYLSLRCYGFNEADVVAMWGE